MEVKSKEDLTAWVLSDGPLTKENMHDVLYWLTMTGLAQPIRYSYGHWNGTVFVTFALDIAVQYEYNSTTTDRMFDIEYDIDSTEWYGIKEHLEC